MAKVRLSFKTPDVTDQLEGEDNTPEIKRFIEKFVEYGEYITIEFDTEAKTAVAVKV